MKKYFFITWIILIIGCSSKPEGISTETIGANDISAKLISKANNSTRPLLIVVPGSGGSFIPSEKLFGLVLSGYDVLSIAYFGEKNLPKMIELIPLEYLQKVVLWSKSKFSGRKIVLLGISKGAEYSLAFASNFDLIDGLICYSPSSFILPNHIGLQDEGMQKSSWSLNGKELPFAELKSFNDKAGKIIYKKYIDLIFGNREQMMKSRIKVENIKCNLLLLSGKEDLVWPSSKMASMLKTEAEKSDEEYKVKQISYENCGHQFVWFDEKEPKTRTEYQSMNLTGIKKHKFLYGGTHEGTIRAMVNSRNEVISFLKDI